MTLSFRVPSDESINTINNITVLFDCRFIGQEDGNIFFIRGSVDCGNEFMNLELDSRIEEDFEVNNITIFYRIKDRIKADQAGEKSIFSKSV